MRDLYETCRETPLMFWRKMVHFRQGQAGIPLPWWWLHSVHVVPWIFSKTTVRVSNHGILTLVSFRFVSLTSLTYVSPFSSAVNACRHRRGYWWSFVSEGLRCPHRLPRAVTKSSNLVSAMLRSIYCTEASDFCSDSVDCRSPETSEPVSTVCYPTSHDEQNMVSLIPGSVAN